MDHHGRNKNIMSMENLLAKETMPHFPLKPFETMLPAPHQLLPLMFSNKQDDVLRLPSLRENRITANHLFADELRL
jgi:hypothetical protein